MKYLNNFFLTLLNESLVKLPRKRNNAKNNARCMQARKTTHGLDRHQDLDRDRTPCGRVNWNDRG